MNRKQRTRPPLWVEEKIMEILETKPSTTLEIANNLLFTISGILHHLKRLKNEELIVKKGYKNKVIWDIA